MLLTFAFDLDRIALPLLIGYGQVWRFADEDLEEFQYKTKISFSVLMVHVEIVF